MSQTKFEEWLAERKISEVECLVADMSGTARGKILPPSKFLKGNRSRGPADSGGDFHPHD